MWQLCEEPKPGDLIEIFCKDYTHWAIYERNSYVICVTPPGDNQGRFNFPFWSSKEVVKRELLKTVAAGCLYRVNNFLDHMCSPLPVDRILSHAKEKIGADMKYRGGGWQFVSHLRYGVAFTKQVRPPLGRPLAS
ncbi:Phospholipase A and acyltransferase 4 [Galemys pyrenaicus]|uniref:Phospholipase A and acyltransferase 4 n=1 Tax=Galemys pyrenaicus TaxID=202257 RepID=A0A8J6DVV6_GALPY|nr:Phospholipase A and acyltransferase 4 [Galemys pyrenaicus]